MFASDFYNFRGVAQIAEYSVPQITRKVIDEGFVATHVCSYDATYPSCIKTSNTFVTQVRLQDVLVTYRGSPSELRFSLSMRDQLRISILIPSD